MNGFNNDEVKSAAWIRNTYKSEKPHSPHTRRRWREIERVNEKWNKEDEERTNEWMKKVFSKQTSKRANKQTNNKNAKLVRYIWYHAFLFFALAGSFSLGARVLVFVCVYICLSLLLSTIQMVEWMKAIVHFKCNHIRLLFTSNRALHTAAPRACVCVLCMPCIQFSEVVKTTKMKPHNSHRTIYFTMCSFSEREQSDNNNNRSINKSLREGKKASSNSCSCSHRFFLWL